MKRSLFLLTTFLAWDVSSLSAADGGFGGGSSIRTVTGKGTFVHSAVPYAASTEVNGAGSIRSATSTVYRTPAASYATSAGATIPYTAANAEDLNKIKTYILGYAGKLGLPSEVKTVASTGCCGLFSTKFDAAQQFLLNELAGQLLTRFLALALDDLADGRLDGIIAGQKISYAQEIASLLGVKISEEELKATPPPVNASLLMRMGGLAFDVTQLVLVNGGQKDELLKAAGAFAKKKMDKARKSLAVALIQEADRIIGLELGNGKVDGLDARGMAIDWKKEMETSVKKSLSRVLDGTL